MKSSSVLTPLFFSLILSSCAFAPYSNNHSARTLGKGNVSVQAGLSANANVPIARLGYGIANNVDIGLLAEEQNNTELFGGWLKYAFINEKEGFSFSAETSAGGSDSSRYFYIGPTVGYKWHWYEPYFTARYNYVAYHNEHNVDLSLFGKLDVNEKGNYQYGLLTLGSTLWATNWLGLNLNANVTVPFTYYYFGAGVVVTF